jgi:hypothetical protein
MLYGDRMENEAKIFGDGDVTIAFNMLTGSARVYIGTQQIGLIQNLKLNINCKEQLTNFELNFPQNPNIHVEEQIRNVKQLIPWAKVI